MAKVSVAMCDHCQVVDTDETPVRRVGVVGVLVDLCAEARYSILMQMGLSEEAADAKVVEQNTGEKSKGKPPRPESLNEAAAEDTISDPESDEDNEDEADAPAEPEIVTSGV